MFFVACNENENKKCNKTKDQENNFLPLHTVFSLSFDTWHINDHLETNQIQKNRLIK